MYTMQDEVPTVMQNVKFDMKCRTLHRLFTAEISFHRAMAQVLTLKIINGVGKEVAKLNILKNVEESLEQPSHWKVSAVNEVFSRNQIK